MMLLVLTDSHTDMMFHQSLVRMYITRRCIIKSDLHMHALHIVGTPRAMRALSSVTVSQAVDNDRLVPNSLSEQADLCC